ncbi:MAG TPA: TonB-dependent receptor [Thermoanaerobaculia bacterium]|nr:TonB-dependent receptor [Thermoanaerobaculia bacterium]
MRRRRSSFSGDLALLALLALSALPLAAQTTGAVEGTISDPAGAPLPGVSLEATSPALQAARIAVTDEAGRFRLSLLPPGRYRILATLKGFTKEEKTVAVGLDRVVTLDLVLAPSRAETLTVTGEAPAVETASTAVGSNLSQRVFQSLPTGRNYASIAQLVAGTSSDDADTRNGAVTVYGSTGLENAYLVDGVNTTGVEFGSQGKILNFEFVQEVEVKTGGYEAEYGHATGGIINVITKSGGNEFHGDAFAYLDRDSLQATNKHEGEVIDAGLQTGFRRSDFGADLGGFAIKDRIWLFGAYDRVNNRVDKEVTTGPEAGTPASVTTKRDVFALKLTTRLSEKSSVILTVFGDPETNEGAVQDPIGPPSTYEGTNKFGGTDLSARYEGLFGGNWIVTAQAARHRERFDVTPGNNGRFLRFEDNRGDTITASGGFGRFDTKDFNRDVGKLEASRFLGDHELKGGLEWEKMYADVSRGYTGEQQVTILNPVEGDTRPVYQHYYWTTDFATLPNAPSVTFTATPNHRQISAFLQDRWRAFPSLTVNAGLRYENQEIVSKFGTTAFRVTHFSPRLGVAWDFTNDGKSKLYASYGQFVEAIPLDMNIRSFSAERNPTVYNFDPVSLVPDPAAGDSIILGGYIEPVDPGLKAQYLDEIILGAEHEIGDGLAVGVRGIYRRLGRVIEDGFVAASGDYFIMNPGEGALGGAYPPARRHFRGLELTAQKRAGKGVQLFASYLLSKLEGNYDGSFRAADGQKDPNINADFDYPEFLVNNDGPLTEDRRHQVKAQVGYTFPFGLTASVFATYRSGAPRTRFGWWDTYGRPELFLTTRGAEGRTPALYEADIHVGYALPVGPVTVNVLLDLFNVLNRQEAITVDNRWDFNQADNVLPTPSNSRYGKGRTFQDPRTLRLGLRVSF